MTKTLFISIYALTVDGMKARLTARTDGEVLEVTLTPLTVGEYYTSALACAVSYNGATQALYESPFRTGASAVFAYDDGVKSLVLSAESVVYGSRTGASVSFEWNGSASSPEPTAELILPGLRLGTTAVLRWNASGAEGYVLCPVYCGRERLYEGGETWDSTDVFAEKRLGVEEIRLAESAAAGTVEKLTVCFALYPSESAQTSSPEDYAGICIASTPEYTVTYRASPYAPWNFAIRGEGIKKRISWNIPEDETYPVTSCQLERSADGGAFTLVYEGISSSFTDTFPEGAQSAVWRVRCVSRKLKRYSVYLTESVQAPRGINVYIGANGIPLRAESVRLGGARVVRVLVGM